MDAVLSPCPLIEYLRACGGHDVLVFPSSNEASEAARELRQRYPDEVEVLARYERVSLRLVERD